MKNSVVDPTFNYRGSFNKNLKNSVKSTNNNESLKTEENKVAISKKHEKKLKYFSEIFQEKNKVKRDLVIATGKTSFIKHPMKTELNSNNATISHNNTGTNSANKTKIVNNPKRFIKSQVFIENFKNLKKKTSTKSTVPIYLCNTNNSNSTSIDNCNLVSSTKSNSIGSSFSNSNAFSNSLKNMNFKSQFSTNNTDASNNSFNQKDLKAKYSSINLNNKQKISTCNVVISLNTHKHRNKKVVSSFINNSDVSKSITTETSKKKMNNGNINKNVYNKK